MKKQFLLAIFSVLLLTACNKTYQVIDEAPTDSSNQNSEDTVPDSDSTTQETTNQDSMSTIDQTALPQKGEKIVVMETTKGTIKIKLFPEQAPKTVENFIGLAENGYYDGIIFHRVMNNFMIQGGDPTGTGMGGESLWGGKFENEISMDLSNIRGSLSMANAGKDTNGSQFFINQVDNTYLNGYENGQMKSCAYPESCHTVFGQVFEGMDVVDTIAGVQTGPGDKPVEEVKMEKVTVETY